MFSDTAWMSILVAFFIAYAYNTLFSSVREDYILWLVQISCPPWSLERAIAVFHIIAVNLPVPPEPPVPKGCQLRT